jgi:hypothetical protein
MNYYKTLTNDLILLKDHGFGIEIETDGMAEIHIKRFSKAEFFKDGDFYVEFNGDSQRTIHEIDEDEFKTRLGVFSKLNLEVL